MLPSLGMGGAERQVVALAERMARRGHSILLLVLRERQPEEWPTHLDVIYLDMHKTPSSIFSSMMRARRLIRQFQPDLVHSHTYPANMAARMLRLTGVPVQILSTIHNVYEGGWARMIAYRLTDFLSVRTTAVSQTAAGRYVRLKAVPLHKCSVVTNAIDTTEFAPDPQRRVQMRDRLSAVEDFIWLAAGRIVPAKDYPNLLQAFTEVRAAWPGTQLWIAAETTGAEYDRVKAHAAELGLDQLIRWLGLRRDMPALLDAADAFVLASAWEGMPLALGEAMAMEKPAVATDVGGVRELVGATVPLVPAKSAERLAEAMLALMRTTGADREQQGRVARERVATGFSIDARADEWEKLYRALLAETPAATTAA
ncbi:MAG: glycosyltransferase [Terracidiphilus sp.]